MEEKNVTLVRPSRWSYSALNTYETCPAQYKYSYLDNLPWESGPYAARGTQVHLAGEEFLKGELDKLPSDFRHVEKYLHELKQNKASAEAVWMVDREWNVTEDKSKAWVKAIVDAHYYDEERDILRIVDFKTGRWYPDHAKQLQLYAILGFCIYPKVRRADVSALYIDQGFYDSQNTYIRTMLEPLKRDWTARAERMYTDNDFVATPSKNNCNWCAYKGGKPCQAGR